MIVYISDVQTYNIHLKKTVSNASISLFLVFLEHLQTERLLVFMVMIKQTETVFFVVFFCIGGFVSAEHRELILVKLKLALA